MPPSDLPGLEAELVARLQGGDESAFVELVDRYAAAMLKTALVFSPTVAEAEEVVQDTWVSVLRAIDRFEGRSTLKTWIFRILVNRARTLAVRRRRLVPFSALEPSGSPDDAAVPPDRFVSPDHGRGPGHWATPPVSWAGLPEERLVAAETMALVRDGIEALPPAQRAVITLRDVHGWSSQEVCEALGLTQANQRVLLHRGRSRVRAMLERQLV